jgi:hypothetical protein
VKVKGEDKMCLTSDRGSDNCGRLVISVRVRVKLRSTVSRPVRLDVGPPLEQVTRFKIYLSDNCFLYSSCRALSHERPGLQFAVQSRTG